MLVPGVYYYYLNLVFRWLGLVVLFSSVVIGYVIRRKWRLAVARKEEIKRLLVLASEEAARAEHEASSGYYGAAVSVARPFQCAVCYSPTTTRCARCKAARYCSGKCQIIHWRQGHKEECRPPTQNYQVIDEVINSKAKAATQDQFGTYDNHFETEDGHHVKPSEAVFEEHAFSNFSHSSEFSCEKNDDVKAEFVADETGTISSSSSSTIFSTGFTSSNITGESSDDASVSESIDSVDLEKLDGHHPSGVAPDALESVNSVAASHTKPLSAEFSSSLAGGHSSAGSLELNQINSVYNDGESRHGSTNCSGLSTTESTGSSVTKPLDASNDFWEGALDSRWSRKDAGDKSAKCISRGESDNHLSDSGTTFFFNFSGNTIPSLHSKGSVVKSVVYDKAQTSSLGMNEANYGAALSNNIRIDAQKVKNPSSSCYERFDHKDDNSVTDSHVLRPKEVRNSISGASVTHLSCSVDRDSTRSDASNITSISSLRSKSSNHVVNGTSGVSHMLKSGEDRSLSSSTCGGHSPSSNVLHSVASVKTGKVDGVQDITNSYQNGSYSPNGTNGLKTSIQKVVDQLISSKLSKNCSIGVGSETVGRYSDKGLFRYELFIKLYAWNKVELLPCGLTNCGNSCYANVVLQCLAFTPPLTAYFLQGLHSKACVNKEWCFICEFESLILKAKEGNSPLSPVGILSHLRNIGSHLGSGKEEDAHEFLRFVIDKMQSVFLKEAGVIAYGSLKEETTLIGLTFGGYLRSKIKCLKCQGKSERHERIMDLTVEIEGDIGTLEEALKQFTRTEILDGENKYQCSRCKSYEKAKKKLKILEAPNVLTIALKRYQSGKFGKLSKSVEFPEILDLAKYMSGTSDKSPIYRLYGVVEHLDIMNAAFSGHYVCYVKNNQNKWFKIDDSSVKPMELRKVKEKGAYMLLYARCSPRAPRLLRNRISRDPKIKVAMPKSRFPPAVPSVTHSYPSLIPSDGLGPASYESFYSGNPMRTIFEADSSSDSSSLLSSCSDEGSCSTDSTRDSTSTDDLSDFIFGPWRNSSDSDTSSSSSPMYGRHSPLSDLDRYASGAHEPSGFRVNQSDSFLEGDGHRTRRSNGSSRLEDLASEENTSFLHSDMTKQCRKLGSSSSCRETDSERLGRVKLFDNVKFGVSCRSSTRERTN